MKRNFPSVVSQKNIEQLAKSLEKLNLYDGKGNQKSILKYKNQNFFKILNGLTLENLSSNM